MTAPSGITAVCAHWGTDCQWHPINTDYVYPTVVDNSPVNSPKNNMVYTPKNTTNNSASSNDDGHDDHFEW